MGIGFTGQRIAIVRTSSSVMPRCPRLREKTGNSVMRLLVQSCLRIGELSCLPRFTVIVLCPWDVLIYPRHTIVMVWASCARPSRGFAVWCTPFSYKCLSVRYIIFFSFQVENIILTRHITKFDLFLCYADCHRFQPNVSSTHLFARISKNTPKLLMFSLFGVRSQKRPNQA